MYDREKQLEAFRQQIARMKANYGEQHFPKEKMDMIWEELRSFSPKQIKNICGFVMDNNKFPPTIQPFREFASMLRDKISQHEREELRQDAKDFWEGTFHTDEVKAMVQTIKLRMEGKLSDSDWREFKQLIKGTRGRPPRCARCEDTDVYYDAQMRAFKCHHGSPISPKTGSFVSRAAEAHD